MKKTDIAMLILIASGSVLISYFVASATPIGKASTEPVEVDTIERIETGVAKPNEDIFNSNAINPSVEIKIDAKPGSASADAS